MRMSVSVIADAVLASYDHFDDDGRSDGFVRML